MSTPIGRPVASLRTGGVQCPFGAPAGGYLSLAASRDQREGATRLGLLFGLRGASAARVEPTPDGSGGRGQDRRRRRCAVSVLPDGLDTAEAVCDDPAEGRVLWRVTVRHTL